MSHSLDVVYVLLLVMKTVGVRAENIRWSKIAQGLLNAGFKGCSILKINPPKLHVCDKKSSRDNTNIFEYILGMCALLITCIPNVTWHFTVEKNVVLIKNIRQSCFTNMSCYKSIAFILRLKKSHLLLEAEGHLDHLSLDS